MRLGRRRASVYYLEREVSLLREALQKTSQQLSLTIDQRNAARADLEQEKGYRHVAQIEAARLAGLLHSLTGRGGQ